MFQFTLLFIAIRFLEIAKFPFLRSKNPYPFFLKKHF